MKKVHKMILYEIVPLFLIVNFFFIFLLLLEQLIELAELVFVRSIPFVLVIETILFYLPSFLTITIPISTMLGVLLAFSRFSADSELVAMFACGANKKTLLLPTLLVGVIATLFGLYINVSLLPKGSSLAVDNINKMLENLSINDIREKEMYNDIKGMIFYANEKIDNANFKEIILIDKNRNAIISAKKGTIIPNASRSLMMQFQDGKFTTISKDNSYSSLTFDSMSLNYPLNLSVAKLPKNHRLFTLSQLKSRFSESNIFKYEYARRFTSSLSAVLMAMIGLAMGQFSQRSSRPLSIGCACVIAFSLEILFMVAENFVNNINPFLLASIPVVLYSTIVVLLLKRLD